MKALLTFLLLSSGLLSAQTWQKIIPGDLSEIPTSLHQLSNGGYLYSMVRNRVSGDANINCQSVLVKADENCNTIWSHSAASANRNFLVAVLKGEETFCMSFYTQSSIQKINPQGKQTEQISPLGFAGGDDVFSTRPLADGGLALFGAHLSPNGNQTLFLAKIGADGKTVWRKENVLKMIFPFVNRSSLAEDASGNILLALTHFSNDSPSVAALARFDKNGNQLHYFTVGDPGTELRAVQSLPDGKYILAGTLSGRTVLYCYDPDNKPIWEKTYRGFSQPEDLAVNIEGVIATLSHFSATVQFYNSNGELLWKKRVQLGADTRGTQLIATADGGFLIAGTTAASPNGNSDIFFMKFEAKDWIQGDERAPESAVTPVASDEPKPELELQFPEILQPEIRVTAFPNPFQDNLTLQIQNLQPDTDGEVILVSVSGSIVHRQEFRDPTIQLNFADLLPGTYFYFILQKGVKVASGKVVRVE